MQFQSSERTEIMWGKQVVHAAQKGNPGFNALMCLQLGLISAFTSNVPKAEVLEHVPAWKKASAEFAKKHKISPKPYDVAIDLLKKIKNPRSDSYSEALHDLHVDVSEAESIMDDLSVSQPQIDMAKAIISLLKSGSEEQLAKRLQKVESMVGTLGSPQLNKWYHPKIADQSVFEKELRFLVKKITGRADHRMTYDEAVVSKEKAPKRHKRYTDLRKQAGDVYKALIRSTVRNSGKTTVPIGAIRKAIKEQGLNIHTMDRLKNFEGRMDENGALYTSNGKKIFGAPGDGYKIIMNPEYDPVKDDKNYFVAEPDNSNPYTKPVQEKAYFYTENYKKAGTQQKFEKVEHLSTKVNSARKKWLLDLESNNKHKAALGALVELLYSHQLRIGNPGNETAGERTYGLTTLLVSHIRFLGSGKIKIVYPGKKSMEQSHVISPNNTINKRIIEVLTMLTSGKKPSANVFQIGSDKITSSEVNSYIKSTGLSTTAHKFRHLAGTVTMNNLMAKTPLKKNADQKETEVYFKKLAEQVGHKLGHFTSDKEGNQKVTANTSIKNYINPQIGIKFFKDRGLRTPKFLQFGEKDK